MNDTNANLVFEADNGLILEKNDAQTQGVPLFSAHWHIFAPTFIILVAYSVSWLVLAMSNMSDSNLARLFIVVMAVFVPLLAAHAFLRYQTIRVQINEDCLFCHPGWPKDLPIEVPIAMIESVAVKRGLSGRLFGGGTLVLSLVAEKKIVIADLAEPQKAQEAILQAISEY